MFLPFILLEILLGQVKRFLSVLQQYIGAVLVILALFMVLFSNYMDERLQSERRVPQINCRLSKPPPLPNVDDFEYIVKDDERMALLAHLPKEYLTQPPTLPV